MDKFLIEALEVISDNLAKEVSQKKEWGNFGNSFGQAESRKFLLACSEILKAIAFRIKV